jgi:hypothetical protein
VDHDHTKAAIEDTSTEIEQAIIERALQNEDLSPASQWISTEQELVSRTLAPEGELSTIERERERERERGTSLMVMRKHPNP